MDPLNAVSLSEAFSTLLPLPRSIDPDFEDALRHVLNNPGSMIRPRLVFEMATAYGLKDVLARDLAIALEYFHTASLLFDDLPCMDDGTERRGVPCTHRLFGEESAILAALALINRAYALTWRAVVRSPKGAQPHVLAFVEQCLGVNGLLNGQSLDLHYAALPHTQGTTELVARGKTVSLIRLTLALPAMLGDAPPRELRLIERLAEFWGLGYQILDDLKDVLQNASQSGKTPTRDALLGHPNLAVIIGIDGAAERLARFISLGNKVLRRLLKLRPSLIFLQNLGEELENELNKVMCDTATLKEECTA